MVSYSDPLLSCDVQLKKKNPQRQHGYEKKKSSTSKQNFTKSLMMGDVTVAKPYIEFMGFPKEHCVLFLLFHEHCIYIQISSLKM